MQRRYSRDASDPYGRDQLVKHLRQACNALPDCLSEFSVAERVVPLALTT
jgi:hypothetical protein